MPPSPFGRGRRSAERQDGRRVPGPLRSAAAAAATSVLVVLGTAVPAHAADALAIDSTTPGLDHGGVTFTGTVSCTGGGALDSPGTRLTTALADVNGNVIPTFGLLANQDAATNGFMLPIPCDGSPQHWMIGLDGFEAILNLGGFNSGNSIQVTVTLTSLLPAHVSGR